jgi:two-component system, LuxR family, sensor kinase FixL
VTIEDNEDRLLRSVALQNAESIRIARRRAEQQTEATLWEQANLLNLTHDSIFVRDMKGAIRYWNRAAEELYGWTSEQALGRRAHDLLKTVFPAALGQIEGQVMRAGRWEGELVHTKKDGSQVVVASRWSLQRDDRDAPVAILETNNDITARKRAEEERERLRRLEADLAHINRVSMMGELAASLAHEIKQPITAAMTDAKTGLRWLAREMPDLQEAREAIMRVEKDAARAVEIINRLRSLYKKDALPEREVVDVNEVAEEIIALLRVEANRYSISMRTELAAELPKARADRVQLQQVFMNLMLNGIEAMKDTAGELEIKSCQTADGQLLVSVSDTGVGIPSEKADQIFDAFFTTKTQGTGMGLAITRSIIESHGGRVWATANSNRGATFNFILPTADKAASVSAGT